MSIIIDSLRSNGEVDQYLKEAICQHGSLPPLLEEELMAYHQHLHGSGISEDFRCIAFYPRIVLMTIKWLVMRTSYAAIMGG